MNDKLRRALPLAVATALAASALAAGSGAVLAGKPLPSASPDAGQCTFITHRGETKYRVGFDLSANKGKWAFVRGGLLLSDGEHPARFAEFTQWDMGDSLQLEADVAGLPEAATMTLYFGDRQGRELTSVSQPLCG